MSLLFKCSLQVFKKNIAWIASWMGVLSFLRILTFRNLIGNWIRYNRFLNIRNKRKTRKQLPQVVCNLNVQADITTTIPFIRSQPFAKCTLFSLEPSTSEVWKRSAFYCQQISTDLVRINASLVRRKKTSLISSRRKRECTWDINVLHRQWCVYTHIREYTTHTPEWFWRN